MMGMNCLILLRNFLENNTVKSISLLFSAYQGVAVKYAIFMLLGTMSWAIGNQLFEVDFCESMGKNNPYYSKKYASCMQSKGLYGFSAAPGSINDLYAFLKKLYQENGLAVIKPSGVRQIPHVTHMVWLGKKFPDAYLPYRASWQYYNPEWTYVIWVDNPVNYSLGRVIDTVEHLAEDLSSGKYMGESLVVDIKNMKFQQQKALESATCFAEKSDIIRLEVIYNFGGLYVDTDFECTRSFDILHDCYTFYAGIQPLDTNLFVVTNGIFGASRYHPILKVTIDLINVLREEDPRQFWKDIVTGTGGVLLTKVFWLMACQPGVERVIAFPPTYFYPIGAGHAQYTPEKKRALIQQETFAMHHWAGNWHGKK